MNQGGGFFSDLRERRVVRFIVGYLIGAWVTAQVAGFFVEQGYVGRKVLDVTLFLVAVGFLAALLLVWYHGEKGQQRVQRVEAVLLGVLALVAAGGSGWIATRGAETSVIASTYDLGDNSVAVLPFENNISSPEMMWLDRGIPDLIATDLSQFDTLRVVSGQRLFDLLRQLGVEDSRTVPRELQEQVTRGAGARYMLTGRVVGTSDEMRLIAQLVDTDTGEIRFSSQLVGDDIFALVDQISSEISSDLLGRRAPADAPIAQLATGSVEAFRELEAGRHAMWQYSMTEARSHFERAVALDSTYAIAHFQLAGLLQRQSDFAAATGHLQAARRHLGTASERDRLSVGAFFDFMFGNDEEGERQYEELLRKYPDEKDARMLYAGFLTRIGRGDEAERLLVDITELDPFFPEAWNLLAYRYARRGDHAGADTLIGRYVELQPGRPNPLDSRGEILEFAGRNEEARDYFRQALELEENFAVSLGHIARSHVRAGDYEGARGELAPYKTSGAAETRVWAWWLTADTRLWEGDIEGGIAAYDSAVVVASLSERPDLHGQVLDGFVRYLLLLERYERANEIGGQLLALRGRDGTNSAAELHYLGSLGEVEGMESVARLLLEESLELPQPETFARAMEVGTQILIDFYRGEHQRAVDQMNEFNQGSPFPLVQIGLPGIRSALEVDDVEAIRAGVGGLRFLTMAPDYRTAPLETRFREYLAARIAETTGDTAAAIAGYDELIASWGRGLDAVPLLSDVRSRREALASE